MSFKRFSTKIFLSLAGVICLFILNPSNCFSAGTPQGYAAIWKAENDNLRKTAAVECFDAVVGSDTTVKHLLVPTELNAGVLGRSLICWLSYDGKDALMQTVRRLLADLYSTVNDVRKIRLWTELAADTPYDDDIITSLQNLKLFANKLQAIRQQIESETEILHTYSLEGRALENHTQEDMSVIDNFIQYLSVCDLENPNTFSQFLGEDQNAKNIVLPELIRRQDALFRRIGAMAEKMLHECFEPCMKAALVNAFHLQGVNQGVQIVPPLVTGAGLVYRYR